MKSNNKCEPEADPEFFKAISEVFQRFPDMCDKYLIGQKGHLDSLKKMYPDMTAVTRLKGNSIVTEMIASDSPDLLNMTCTKTCVNSEGQLYCCAIG